MTPVYTVRDTDGIDIYFLNHDCIYTSVSDVYAVESIFNRVVPRDMVDIVPNNRVEADSLSVETVLEDGAWRGASTI